MPVEQVNRSVSIDDIIVSVSAWRWICDKCGRREAFHDIPMPEHASELEAQRRGWRLSFITDEEQCFCHVCNSQR